MDTGKNPVSISNILVWAKTLPQKFSLVGHRHNNATSRTDGFMSAKDKIKLDGLSSDGVGGGSTSNDLIFFNSCGELEDLVISSGVIEDAPLGWNTFKFPEPFRTTPTVYCQSEGRHVDVREVTPEGFLYRMYIYDMAYRYYTSMYAFSQNSSASSSYLTQFEPIYSVDVIKSGSESKSTVTFAAYVNENGSNVKKVFTALAGTKAIYVMASSGSSSKWVYVEDGSNYKNNTTILAGSNTGSVVNTTAKIVTLSDWAKEASGTIHWLAIAKEGE